MTGPSPTAVLNHLREQGITVHHTSLAADGAPTVVVFLEGNTGHEDAALAVARLPGVTGVDFATDTTAIMLVSIDP